MLRARDRSSCVLSYSSPRLAAMSLLQGRGELIEDGLQPLQELGVLSSPNSHRVSVGVLRRRRLQRSAIELQGEDVLVQIARELVAVMRRDIKPDWIVVRVGGDRAVERSCLEEHVGDPHHLAGVPVSNVLVEVDRTVEHGEKAAGNLVHNRGSSLARLVGDNGRRGSP